jgi:hypothetical protein
MQPSMDVCAWIHQAQDRSWRPCVMRTPDPAMRTSPSHVYYPWQVFQRWRLRSQEGPLHQGSATPRCPEHQVFSKTGRYRVPSTLARRQQFSWRRNRPEPLPRGLWTAVHSRRCCHYHFKTPFKPGRKCRRRRGLGRSSKDLNRRSCPDYPARRGD